MRQRRVAKLLIVALVASGLGSGMLTLLACQQSSTTQPGQSGGSGCACVIPLGPFGIAIPIGKVSVPVGQQAMLEGRESVSFVADEGEGTATFTLSDDQTELEFDVQALGLDGRVAEAKFHIATPDESEELLFVDVTDRVTESEGRVSIEGAWELTEADRKALLDGNVSFELYLSE